MNDAEIICWAKHQEPPPGYVVVWSPIVEHYYGMRVDETWESAITVNRWDARRWCFEHAAKQS